MTGTIIRRLGGDTGRMGTIKGIMTSDSDTKDKKVSCKIGTKIMNVNEEYNIQIDRPNTAISCSKEPNRSLKINLLTSEIDTGWIDLPNVEDQKQTRIDEMNDAINALRGQIATTIPRSTVAAFQLESCPQGWSRYDNANGRVIVGEGSGTNLTNRSLLSVGGEETHTLLIDEMPSHNHGGLYGGTSKKAGMNEEPAYHTSGYQQILTQGGDKPHNNMQPFIVLLYCIKG
jgi:hypothetical protein